MDDDMDQPLPNPYQSTPLHDDVPRPTLDAHEDLSVTAMILQQTLPWLLLVATFGILTVLFVFGVVASRLVVGGGSGMPGLAEIILFIVVFGLVPTVPLVLILRYAQRISRFVTDPSVNHLVSALKTMRNFWRFVGGAVLAILALYMVAVLGSASFWFLMR